MTTSEAAVEELLGLAKAALCKQEPEKQLEAIETYCERFKQLEASLEVTAGPEVEALADKHQRVLRKAQELLTGAAKDMQAFKKRAKGIMAYVDILPGKISVTGTKKG